MLSGITCQSKRGLPIGSVIELSLSKGDILYREGDNNNCAYLIARGEIVLYTGTDGRRVEVERRGPGSIVGELSILTGQARTVTVEALNDCTVFRIPAASILDRYAALDPVLRACVDTAISFVARYAGSEQIDTNAPMANSTLQQPDALIADFRFEVDIEKGLREDEFSMAYQPIVRITDQKMIGVEALMRWQHPVRGFVPPDEFIKVAEKMGSIGKLTNFAVAQACAALQAFQQVPGAPRDLFVSINISAADLARKDFVPYLHWIMQERDLNAHHIRLEVTETALLPDEDKVMENLTALRKMGCGLSIDDFGTGYSNLAYLNSLPLNAIKIDRTFAGHVHDDATARGIVRMLVGLGRELGVDIIAEGIETLDDVETLQQLGCRYGQGYYFHKPALAQDIIDLLAGYRPALSGVA